MLKTAVLVLLLVSAPTALSAEWNLVWKVSVGGLVIGTAFDAASTWDSREANPLLWNADKPFRGRALAIKSAVVCGAWYLQRRAIRKHPRSAKILAITNFAATGLLVGASVRNWRMN